MHLSRAYQGEMKDENSTADSTERRRRWWTETEIRQHFCGLHALALDDIERLRRDGAATTQPPIEWRVRETVAATHQQVGAHGPRS